MKIKIIAIAMLFSLLLLSGCSSQEKEEPTGPTPNVCIDDNNNGICDNAETEPEPVDHCENVTCESKCEGSTLFSEGTCVEGECIYANETQNSEECGYKEPMHLAIEKFKCKWWSDGSFYLFIKNLDTQPTEKGGSIWLFVDNGEKIGHTLHKSYAKNNYLLDVHLKDVYWLIEKASIKNNYGFRFVYCPPNIPYLDCTAENGVIFYEGHTSQCSNPATEAEFGTLYWKEWYVDGNTLWGFRPSEEYLDTYNTLSVEVDEIKIEQNPFYAYVEFEYSPNGETAKAETYASPGNPFMADLPEGLDVKGLFRDDEGNPYYEETPLLVKAVEQEDVNSVARVQIERKDLLLELPRVN